MCTSSSILQQTAKVKVCCLHTHLNSRETAHTFFMTMSGEKRLSPVTHNQLLKALHREYRAFFLLLPLSFSLGLLSCVSLSSQSPKRSTYLPCLQLHSFPSPPNTSQPPFLVFASKHWYNLVHLAAHYSREGRHPLSCHCTG